MLSSSGEGGGGLEQKSIMPLDALCQNSRLGIVFAKYPQSAAEGIDLAITDYISVGKAFGHPSVTS